jgi:hypothetical protein
VASPDASATVAPGDVGVTEAPTVAVPACLAIENVVVPRVTSLKNPATTAMSHCPAVTEAESESSRAVAELLASLLATP